MLRFAAGPIINACCIGSEGRAAVPLWRETTLEALVEKMVASAVSHSFEVNLSTWRLCMFKRYYLVFLYAVSCAPCFAQEKEPAASRAVGMSRSDLFVAVSKGQVDKVRQLLDKGANPNEEGGDGERPLGRAVSNGQAKTAALLLERGARVDGCDSWGFTPLMDAARNGRISLVRLLLSKGASIRRQDAFGATPLMHASYYGYTEIAKLLIEQKADINAKDRRGDTALSIAIKYKRRALVDLLKKAGAQ